MECPILHETMVDPVICSDGHTYERRAIEQWFREHGTSPMTNLPITSNLIPNIALRQMISSRPSDDIICYSFGNILKIVCKEKATKTPIDIVLAIDNSGSMEISAGIPGQIETQCYSRLDLVKHSVLCILETLDEHDRISVVVYNSSANLLLTPMYMTPENKKKAQDAVKRIHAGGSTNIWDALNTSMRQDQDSILFFTDGQPTSGPMNIVQKLRTTEYKGKIYTFGFSNDVNSTLLNDIGEFYFICDSTMIFTVIVNFLANMRNLVGRVNGQNVYGGQTKYIKGSSAHMVYTDTTTRDITPIQLHEADTEGVCIMEFIDIITNSPTRRQLEDFVDKYRDDSGPFVKDLLANITDQVYLAVSQEYYSKWGKHYLYMFATGLREQINTNFKDPCVQHFKGFSFERYQTELDQVVEHVPAPPPSLIYQGRTYEVRSMSFFNSTSNPCFLPYNRVRMGDGTMKQVSDIKKGDRVKTPHGSSRVLCVLKTFMEAGVPCMISQVGTLYVTPWHPIRYNDEWVFPQDIQPAIPTVTDAVYSFVIEEHHIMNIENTDVICLGHGYTNGILKHPFWGTHKVIESMKRSLGWEKGIIHLRSGCCVKDQVTKLICDLNI